VSRRYHKKAEDFSLQARDLIAGLTLDTEQETAWEVRGGLALVYADEAKIGNLERAKRPLYHLRQALHCAEMVGDDAGAGVGRLMIAILLFGLVDRSSISRSGLDAAALQGRIDLLNDARVYAEAALATLRLCPEKRKDVRRTEALLAQIDRALVYVKAPTQSERRGLWGLTGIVHRIFRSVHQHRS
jgi:hypothetical protein